MANFDTNEDEVLTLPEAQHIRRIEVCTDSIITLAGIEKMAQLQELIAQGNWSHGCIYQVDLSGNPILRCCHLDDNQLRTVDLSANPMLEEFTIGGNPLTSIDFSQCTQLNSVWCYDSPNLEELDLTASNCTEHDWICAQSCPKLRYIYLRKGHTINHLEKDPHTEIIYIDR